MCQVTTHGSAKHTHQRKRRDPRKHVPSLDPHSSLCFLLYVHSPAQWDERDRLPKFGAHAPGKQPLRKNLQEQLCAQAGKCSSQEARQASFLQGKRGLTAPGHFGRNCRFTEMTEQQVVNGAKKHNLAYSSSIGSEYWLQSLTHHFI